MWAALRSRTFSLPSSSSYYSSSSAIQQWKSGFNRGLSSLNNNNTIKEGQGEVGGLLNLEEVEKILSDVRVDVKVVPVKNTSFADFVVVATGRSAWHVRNIAQALIYEAIQTWLWHLLVIKQIC